MIKTINQNATAEIVVKKSKFIANLFYVETEAQAQEILKQTNKKYNDARHNCYAYIIKEINESEVIQIQKSSDNGEPSGTAGAPLLDLLKKQGLSNVMVVVTRYFGGVLLGTGGLVKAYTESASKALSKTDIVNREIGNLYEIEVEYSDLKNIEHNAEIIGYKVKEIEYGESVKIGVLSTEDRFKELMKLSNSIISQSIKEKRLWI